MAHAFIARPGFICKKPSQTGPYVCNRCNNIYSWPESLRRHQRLECGVEPQYQCCGCHKKFTHKHNLTVHVKKNKCLAATALY